MNIIAWIFRVFIGRIILILIPGCVINFIHYPPTLLLEEYRIKKCDVIYSSINKDQELKDLIFNFNLGY